MIVHESENLFPINLVIDSSNEVDYQLIYASQLYGTFFAVGALLNLTEDKQKLKSIDLAINNYKGLYNIGFAPHTKNTWKLNEGTGLMVLYLQAYNGTNTSHLSKSIPIELHSEVPLSDLRRFFTTRVVKSFSESSAIKHHLDEGAFDSEFYVRNGKHIAAIERMDNYLPHDIPTDINPKAGPKNCMTSTTIII